MSAVYPCVIERTWGIGRLLRDEVIKSSKTKTKMNEGNSQQPLRDKLSHELFIVWPKENVSSQRQHYCVCKILEKWLVKCDIWNNSCKEYNEMDSVCLRPWIRTSGDELLLTVMFQGTPSGKFIEIAMGI